MAYLDPFEIVNQKVLPCFRKELVKELSEKGMKRKEVAEALELTPVAVHYYIKGTRGSGFEFNRQELDLIKETANDFYKSKNVFKLKTGFKKLVDSLFVNRRLCYICGGKNCNCI